MPYLPFISTIVAVISQTTTTMVLILKGTTVQNARFAWLCTAIQGNFLLVGSFSTFPRSLLTGVSSSSKVYHRRLTKENLSYRAAPLRSLSSSKKSLSRKRLVRLSFHQDGSIHIIDSFFRYIAPGTGLLSG